MEYFLINNYHIVQLLHLIFAIFWIAGLLTLPILKMNRENISIATINKLYLLPGMLGTSILGLTMLYIVGFALGYWLHLKLLLVAVILFLHGIILHCIKNNYIKALKPLLIITIITIIATLTTAILKFDI